MSNFEELHESIPDLCSVRLAFQKTSSTPDSSVDRSKSVTGEKKYPKILKLPESRMDAMEKKVDGLSNRMA